MHGLGFLSSWADYLHPSHPTSLTPQIALGNPTSQSGVQFEGFVEYAYDRVMYLADYPGTYATNLSAEMISRFGDLGANFTDAAALGDAFTSSNANQVGEWMLGNATRDQAIQQALMITNATGATLRTNYTLGPPITLETSFNPFASGSSLNHVDSEMYLGTADFLMRYSTPMGKTLQELVSDYGTSGDSTYGAIGPGIRYILAGMGYRIRGGIPLGGSVPNKSSNNGANGTTTANSTTAGKSDADRLLVGNGVSKMWIGFLGGILGSWVLFG
jgi:hypothetical protein